MAFSRGRDDLGDARGPRSAHLAAKVLAAQVMAAQVVAAQVLFLPVLQLGEQALS